MFAVVGGVKINLATDGRHADAVAVAADSTDDASHEMLSLGMVNSAEAQRIQIRHRPRAHREYIAEDAANAPSRPPGRVR